jgi:hypothetical protein
MSIRIGDKPRTCGRGPWPVDRESTSTGSPGLSTQRTRTGREDRPHAPARRGEGVRRGDPGATAPVRCACCWKRIEHAASGRRAARGLLASSPPETETGVPDRQGAGIRRLDAVLEPRNDLPSSLGGELATGSQPLRGDSVGRRNRTGRGGSEPVCYPILRRNQRSGVVTTNCSEGYVPSTRSPHAPDLLLSTTFRWGRERWFVESV